MKTFFQILILVLVQPVMAFPWMGDDPKPEPVKKYEYVVLKSGKIMSPGARVNHDLGITSKETILPIFEDEDVRSRFTSDVLLSEEVARTLLSKGEYKFLSNRDVNRHKEYSEFFTTTVCSRVSLHVIPKEDGTFHVDRRLNEFDSTSWPNVRWFQFMGIFIVAIALGWRVTYLAFGDRKKLVDLPVVCIIVYLLYWSSWREHLWIFSLVYAVIPAMCLLVKLYSEVKRRRIIRRAATQ